MQAETNPLEFSLLMSVYDGERATDFEAALNSIAASTVLPTEIVLVIDGPVRPELLDIIRKAQTYLLIKTIPLEVNVGLGQALNIGLQQCRYEWVARFDADDLVHPDRFEKQTTFLQSNVNIDILGGWVTEFIDAPSNTTTTRYVPKDHSTIVKFAKARNPFNHGTVFAKKSALIKAGSYQNEHLYEDYALWVRLLMAGSITHNLQEPLVYLRADADMYRRRGGFKYACAELRAQIQFYKIGFIPFYRLILNLAQRFPIRLLPTPIRRWIYNTILR